MEYRYGSLYVVETAQPRDTVVQHLKAIDDRLFVEKQIAVADNKPVWCVVCAIGGDQPPVTILEWRDSDGNPLELSSGIVGRMERMERDGKRLADKVIRQNIAKRDRQRAEIDAAYRDVTQEFVDRAATDRSTILPRSQSLRMSRDKQRAQGRKV